MNRRTIPLPPALLQSLESTQTAPTPHLLVVSVEEQKVHCLTQAPPSTDSRSSPPPAYFLDRSLIASTSRFGTGQQANSNKTPLGLHRIAQKIGHNAAVGTIFKGRVPVGFLGDGKTEGAICHRILWLEGLQEGWNRGGTCDTFQRYIYIHGFGDETTLGKPASLGCVHLGVGDLISLFDRVPEGTLVWIQEGVMGVEVGGV